MINYIDIDKTKVPYQFDIKLNNTTYTFDIKYNTVGDFFTIDLYKQGKIVIYGEKIVYGKPIFNSKSKILNGKRIIEPQGIDFPKVIILPYDLAKLEKTASYSNLGETVFLYTLTEDDLNV